jgi:peptidoglycan hydrolase-like protein with peptidoglycan-binding domain
VIGAKTKAAISAYQASQGLPVTGEPSLDLLRRLRG